MTLSNEGGYRGEGKQRGGGEHRGGRGSRSPGLSVHRSTRGRCARFGSPFGSGRGGPARRLGGQREEPQGDVAAALRQRGKVRKGEEPSVGEEGADHLCENR